MIPRKAINTADAVACVASGNRVFIHGSAATPLPLIKALLSRSDLHGVELVSISTLGDLNLSNQPPGRFFMNSLFVSSNVREAVNNEGGGYVPIFLSEINLLFSRNILPIDVALIQVSPPDAHGYCSLGTSVDITRAALGCARKVVAMINRQMPRTHGDGVIPYSAIDVALESDEPLPEVRYSDKMDSCALTIGRRCADLIEDRATIQTGIGAIPDAVLSCLTNHKDLGVHTEMFSDGLLPLVRKGVITNRFKKKHRGKIVTGFVIGSRQLYDFVDDNPTVAFLDIDYVNDSKVIRANPRVVAINSALQIDLTGQVCADSIGTYQYSGVGGQMDFMRGAALSENGKPVIALRSTAKGGVSRIVPFLDQGSGVVTTRAHVHYVVTEHGTVNLFGKNLRQRAQALAGIAAPEHRESLDRAIFERFGSALVFVR
jgi:acyl-CoA hydrolase